MAGTVRYAKIESPTARKQLKRLKLPERLKRRWRTISPGQAHLGYVPKPGAQPGRWVLRQYKNSKYSITPLGDADDNAPANDDNVLSFEQAETKARTILDRPAAVSPGMTVREAMADYIEYKKSQGQPTSDLQSRSDAHILPTLGDLIVADLKAKRLRKWLTALAAGPALKRSKRGGKQQYRPAPANDKDVRRRQSSANRVLTMLKAALNHAFDDDEEEKISNNDAWGRRLKPFRNADDARDRYLTVAEAKRLINACEPEFRPMVQAALLSGGRYGQLAKLVVQDFNRDAGTLQMTTRKGDGTVRVYHVHLTEEGLAFFKQAVVGRAGNALIFTHNDGSAWKPSHQNRPMIEACERAKIKPRISFHILRHTWASLAVMAGVPLPVVAKNLGHADTGMVEKHYGHFAPGYIKDAIRAGAPRFGIETDKTVVALDQAKR